MRAMFEIETAVSAYTLGTDGESRGRPGRPGIGFPGDRATSPQRPVARRVGHGSWLTTRLSPGARSI